MIQRLLLPNMLILNRIRKSAGKEVEKKLVANVQFAAGEPYSFSSQQCQELDDLLTKVLLSSHLISVCSDANHFSPF